jgi:signal transduction histidine kinase
VVNACLSLACGLSFYVGFAAPKWLRRAWQEPDIRRFLGQAVSLPHISDSQSVLIELERCVAELFGAYRTVIRLQDTETGTLEAAVKSGPPVVMVEPHAMVCFEEQRPAFSENLPREDPEHADLYSIRDVRSVLTAPISVPGRQYGVLSIYAVRAPMFADDDLTLAQLLAQQMAVILEARDLIAKSARVLAAEESTRLKNDFLSAAAHDLKTPLTALIVQSQLMEYRAQREPAAPADLHGLQRLVRDADRLQRLVTELLDVERAEEGRLLHKLENVDLGIIVRQVCEEFESPHHVFECDLRSNSVVCCDVVRVRQLVSNLIENASKYSPQGGAIKLATWVENSMGHVTVADEGVGIPASDLDHVFERFHRGDNVDDRRFAGMGLGLFICREIAHQHGGEIAVSSDGAGHGAVFHLRLPVSQQGRVASDQKITAAEEFARMRS